jgi:hypothetical protein
LFFRLNSAVRDSTGTPDAAGGHRRNFEYLLLGSTAVWQHLNPGEYNQGTDNRLLSFAFYHRSLFADFLILQRMFSYLREGGCVVVTVDCAMPLRADGLTYADLRLLHRVTLLSLNIKFGGYRKEYPLFFYPRFSAGFLSAMMCKEVACRLHKPAAFLPGVRPDVLDGRKISTTVETIRKMAGFCSVRGLQLKVILLADNDQAATVSAKIKDGLSARDTGLSVFVIRRMEEISGIMR